jgi:uncharacterized protein YkwD
MPEQGNGAGMRQLKHAAALSALLALAGCQSWLSGVEGTGASASATEHLARIRAEHGLPALVSDSRLEKAALKQSGYMAASARMTHDTGWGKDFSTRMKKDGIDGVAAENLARGRMDLNRLFKMWMNSSGHRKNMLDPRLTRFGLASAPAKKGSDERYWTLVVGE